jgi:hypothetical protein
MSDIKKKLSQRGGGGVRKFGQPSFNRCKVSRLSMKLKNLISLIRHLINE